jgi:anti-sigma B factor antagonist
LEEALDPVAFTVSVDEGRGAVVRLTGELDLAGVPLLQSVLARLDGDVELDCSGLEFIDASGLRAFHEALRTCDGRGCKLVLVDPSPAVLRLLQMVEMDTVFLIRQESEAP